MDSPIPSIPKKKFPIVPVVIAVVGALIILGMLYFRFTKKTVEVKQPNVVKNEDSKNKRAYYDKKGALIADISVSSIIPGYSVTFVDKTAFLNTLQLWGLYDREFVKGIKVNKIDIVLTDVPQPLLLINNDKKELMSAVNAIVSYGSKDTQTVQVLVYVSPNALPNVNNYFEEQALRILFGLSKPTAFTQQQSQDAFKTFLSTREQKMQVFMKVIKK